MLGPAAGLSSQRRHQLLRATEAIIGEGGISALTPQRIADRAGLSRGQVLHYLGDREHACAALLAELTGRFQRRLRHRLDRVPSSERLETLVDVLFGEHWLYVSDQEAALLHRLLADAASGLLSADDVGGVFETITDEVAARMVEGADDGHDREVARIVVSLSFGDRVARGRIRGTAARSLVRSLLRLPE